MRKSRLKSVAESSPSAALPWTELPLGLTENILQRLDAVDKLKTAENVCRTWRKVCQNPSMWRVVNIVRYGKRPSEEQCYTMCRRAVDRSQGQLIDLTIVNFGDGDLLDYIVKRSNLRRLKLENCNKILRRGCGDCVRKAAKRLPELEELHLDYRFSFISDRGIPPVGDIGIACPKLKSFTLKGANPKVCAEIAKSMPNLQHLVLCCDYLHDKDLELILDGCPHLESLDILVWSNFELREPLRKRCQQQMKHLRVKSRFTTQV